jgi:glycerophosphoryl diester phosphodiesterase
MRLARWHRRARPLVIAHRGESETLPEQTIEAFARAIELGADMLEGDVQLSRDGQLVMMHDGILDRTTDGVGRVPDLTLAELQDPRRGQLVLAGDCGTAHPHRARRPPPGMRSGVEVCLEAKGDSTEESTAISLAIVELIRELDAFDAVALNSFHHDSLARAKEIAPQLALGPRPVARQHPARRGGDAAPGGGAGRSGRSCRVIAPVATETVRVLH